MRKPYKLTKEELAPELWSKMQVKLVEKVSNFENLLIVPIEGTGRYSFNFQKKQFEQNGEPVDLMDGTVVFLTSKDKIFGIVAKENGKYKFLSNERIFHNITSLRRLARFEIGSGFLSGTSVIIPFQPYNVGLQENSFLSVSNGYFSVPRNVKVRAYIKIFGSFPQNQQTKIAFIALKLYDDQNYLIEHIDGERLKIPIATGEDRYLDSYRLKGYFLCEFQRAKRYLFQIECVQDLGGVPLSVENNSYFATFYVEEIMEGI